MAPPDQDLELSPDPTGGHRVQTLLSSVRDLALSLHRLTVQLERELDPAAEGGDPDADRPQAERQPDRASDRTAGGLQAEVERLRTELEQLRSAQEARTVIEQAKGMLMADRRCTDRQAFELLVGMSQAEQRKVRDIAAELVATAAPRPGPIPVRPRVRIDLDGADRADADRAGREEQAVPTGRHSRPV